MAELVNSVISHCGRVITATETNNSLCYCVRSACEEMLSYQLRREAIIILPAVLLLFLLFSFGSNEQSSQVDHMQRVLNGLNNQPVLCCIL